MQELVDLVQWSRLEQWSYNWAATDIFFGNQVTMLGDARMAASSRKIEEAKENDSERVETEQQGATSRWTADPH